MRKVKTSPNDMSAKTAPNAKASFTPMRPLVTGRSAVRFTCRSKLRSATSFKQQPALRIKIVPSVNTAIKCQPGKPSAATHKADKVGHNKSSQPAGRFQRIKSKYRTSFSRIRHCTFFRKIVGSPSSGQTRDAWQLACVNGVAQCGDGFITCETFSPS